MTDADRRAIGLPVRDRRPAPTPQPKTRTEMDIDFAEIAQHTLRVRDSESKNPGKPPRIIGFEIWRQVGKNTAPLFEEMHLVELAIRSPHTLEYASADRGKTVWYATRWVNTRGEKGPWSEIISAIIA
jgi:hypothetical protein